ncbi:hypothetical protein AK812_SmicGene23279 [Symbiodinium microadriaticum]|uniref:Uncharacterized protein n=1 Tax=Symbiodinium microadriaticum TaxID=2951 RepID=A0A1Q9DHU0_SYMMI|nr:hypothetical protein AK812_SmicGene23279 [Symbiodinium microadriaticum]
MIGAAAFTATTAKERDCNKATTETPAEWMMFCTKSKHFMADFDLSEHAGGFPSALVSDFTLTAEMPGGRTSHGYGKASYGPKPGKAAAGSGTVVTVAPLNLKHVAHHDAS